MIGDKRMEMPKDVDSLQAFEGDDCIDGSPMTKIKTCDECELGGKENFPCQYNNEPKTCPMNK